MQADLDGGMIGNMAGSWMISQDGVFESGRDGGMEA